MAAADVGTDASRHVEPSSSDAQQPSKCCGYQPSADDRALLELCDVQGTFGTITARDVFRVFLSEQCSTVERLEEREPSTFKELLARTKSFQKQFKGLYRAHGEGEGRCLRSWLCQEIAMAGSNMCIACSWLPRDRTIKQRIRTASIHYTKAYDIFLY